MTIELTPRQYETLKVIVNHAFTQATIHQDQDILQVLDELKVALSNPK